MTPSKYDGLAEFRCIGPFRGGRVVAVAGDPRDPNVFYFGGVCGGVWKTTDAGQYWQNISDGYFTASSVGALEVAPADPNVIYAGTGETTIRIDVSIGDGVYKSTDAGRSWTASGHERDAPDRQDQDAPGKRRSGLHGGFWPRLWSERRARRLSLEGRRRKLGAGLARQRGSRRYRPEHRQEQSAHHLRRLSGKPIATSGRFHRGARTAACGAPPTAATAGRTSAARRACRKVCWARSAWRHRRRRAGGSGPSSRTSPTAASIAAMITARPGSWAARTTA